jgi:hypothetical protein
MKKALLFIVMFVLMSVSALAWTEDFDRPNEEPINSSYWRSTSFHDYSYPSYNHSAYIKDESLRFSFSPDNQWKSIGAYYIQSMTFPINITATYYGSSGTSAIIIGIGLDINALSINQSTSNIYAEWSTTNAGLNYYINGEKAGFLANFSSIQTPEPCGDEYDIDGGGGDKNIIRMYVDNDFIGFKNWKYLCNEPEEWESLNFTVDINPTSFYNKYFFIGMSENPEGYSYMVPIIDNITFHEQPYYQAFDQDGGLVYNESAYTYILATPEDDEPYNTSVFHDYCLSALSTTLVEYFS